jgi:5-methylcytosine-specific restriction endonuclease McrA
MKLSDFKLQDIGNTIQMAGAVYAGQGKAYLVPFPLDQEIASLPLEKLEMGPEEWKVFLRQTDLMEVEVITKSSDGVIAKAMLRKCERNISPVLQWKVFRRDEYMCRYCGNSEVPLTVDHLVLWEEAGPTIEENMVAACKNCNKARGNMQYANWLQSDYYKRVSRGLREDVFRANQALVATLTAIPRKYHIASR